eukprot:2645359-Prymnesium_polylepis.1
MAGVGIALRLAAEGNRAEALSFFLQASTGPLPGQEQKAALTIFDVCTAFTPSQQYVGHAQAQLDMH